MSTKTRTHQLVGVDGDEHAGTVTYHYGVFWADEYEDIGRHATPIREYARVVKAAAIDSRDGE